jgi:hypothetical protein
MRTVALRSLAIRSALYLSLGCLVLTAIAPLTANAHAPLDRAGAATSGTQQAPPSQTLRGLPPLSLHFSFGHVGSGARRHKTVTTIRIDHLARGEHVTWYCNCKKAVPHTVQVHTGRGVIEFKDVNVILAGYGGEIIFKFTSTKPGYLITEQEVGVLNNGHVIDGGRECLRYPSRHAPPEFLKC